MTFVLQTTRGDVYIFERCFRFENSCFQNVLTGFASDVIKTLMEPFYRAVLSTHLSDRQRKNARFSLRSFAKQLDISPGQLSGLMSGKKNLTTKQAVKIIDKLELSEQESFDLLRGLHPSLQNKKAIQPDRQLISDDEFRLIADWYHFAILSLGKIRENQATPQWIAAQLGLDGVTAQSALHRLERMGLVEIRDGRFRQTSKPLTTTTEVPSRAIRDYHRQNLKLAEEKLESVAITARQFSSVTMAIHPRNLPKAKKMINEFSQKVCDELETKDPSEVYTMAIQLFPLTKLPTKPERRRSEQMANKFLLISIFLTFLTNVSIARAGNFVGNGGDANAMEFTWLARVVTKRLENVKTLSSAQRKHVAAIAKAIDETRVASAIKLVLQGQEVDAINFPDRKLIVLRRGGWAQMKRNKLSVRFGFVLHEFSGVAKIDDGQYAKSQALVGQLFDEKPAEIPFEEPLLDSLLMTKLELNSAFRLTEFYLKKNQTYNPRGVCYLAGSLRSFVSGLSMLFMTGRPKYVGYNPDEQLDQIDKAARAMKAACGDAKLDILSFRNEVQGAMGALDVLSASVLPRFDLSKPE